MKKAVFHPILFALNPILLLFSANVSDIPVPQIFPIVLIVPLVFGGIFLYTSKKLKDTQRIGFVFFIFEIWFFHYGTVHAMAFPYLAKLVNINPHWLFFPAWGVFFVFLGSNYLWKNIRSPETITNFLNILAVVLVAFSTTRIIFDLLPRYTERQLTDFVIQALPQQNRMPDKPDIFYIIVDGYARADVLSTLYGFSNQAFLRELEDRGFQIPSQSKSNYMQTALSLASSLNLDYLMDISPNMPDRGQLIGRIAHSQVRSVLELQGYEIISFASGYPPTEIADADVYYQPQKSENNYDFEALLAANTILKPLFESGWLGLPIRRYQTQQRQILFTFQTLSSLPSSPAPRFVFAHLLIPHPPFIFDENGPVTPDEFYILADGERLGNAYAAYQHGYTQQIQYTNQMLLQTIDLILQNATKSPIIIIQADHGPGMYLNTSSASTSCHYERFSNFLAMYLPEQQSVKIPDDITPVNIFRLIFNLYFGTNFELLPNQQYYATWLHPYDFIDVTDQTDIRCKLP